MIKRLPIDPFLLKLFATVALASLLPAQGWGVPLFQHITQIAIALLFFLHGARLSREAIWGGLSHWRLHLLRLHIGLHPACHITHTGLHATRFVQ